MILAGYLAAILIGVSLGLLGAGGSILTVPILVYFLGIAPVLATGYSLFIIGVSSCIGAVGYMKKKMLDYKIALTFGIPSLITVFLTRHFLLPSIPQILFTLFQVEFTKDKAMMILLSLLMFTASLSMIRKDKISKKEDTEPISKKDYLFIVLKGLLVGLITGMVGVGSGFLIVPALILLNHMHMKKAVGTSLLIIAGNSLVGFAGDLSIGIELDWKILLLFSGLSTIGIFIGMYASRFIPEVRLKPAFGWFILLMGVFIIFKEIY